MDWKVPKLELEMIFLVGLQLESKKFNRIRLFVQQKQMQIRNGFQVIYQIVKLPEKMMVKYFLVTLSRNRRKISSIQRQRNERSKRANAKDHKIQSKRTTVLCYLIFFYNILFYNQKK